MRSICKWWSWYACLMVGNVFQGMKRPVVLFACITYRVRHGTLSSMLVSPCLMLCCENDKYDRAAGVCCKGHHSE